MIKKMMLALVAAAMLVAMAIPAFALNPTAVSENAAKQALEQEQEQEQNQANVCGNNNQASSSAENNAVQSGGIVNSPFANLEQEQNVTQDADATTVQVNAPECENEAEQNATQAAEQNVEQNSIVAAINAFINSLLLGLGL